MDYSSFSSSHDKFTNLIVNDRFVIENKIGEGTFGSVYNCKDNKNPKEKLVMKISSNRGTAENEVTVLEKINSAAKGKVKNNLPQIKCKGFFCTGSKEDDTLEKHYMFIMKKFGMTIEDYSLMCSNGSGLNFGI